MSEKIKAISALDNQLIQDNFKKSYEDIDFLLEDISYQEGLLDALKTVSPDALIINLDIEGDLNRFSFIQAIRDTNCRKTSGIRTKTGSLSSPWTSRVGLPT